MAKVTEEQRAVALILEHLHQEGQDWFRLSNQPGVQFYEQLRETYELAERSQVEQVRQKSTSQFPVRNIVVVVPPAKEADPLLGLWCRWDFTQTPAKCGFYIGLWSKHDGKHSFVGFRFETPEEGEQHDYYHCQPCRNLGDREKSDDFAVAISERVPTFSLPAENSAELALNMVLALRGRSGFEKFRRDLLVANAEARNSPVLQSGFRRLAQLPNGKPPAEPAAAAA
jgi:hypothetical protein